MLCVKVVKKLKNNIINIGHTNIPNKLCSKLPTNITVCNIKIITSPN